MVFINEFDYCFILVTVDIFLLILLYYIFQDSLVLNGPSSPMTAWAGCWGIDIDVPVGSSLLPENSARNEIPRTVFKRTLDLNDYFLNKPKSTMICARGGFINI